MPKYAKPICSGISNAFSFSCSFKFNNKAGENSPVCFLVFIFGVSTCVYHSLRMNFNFCCYRTTDRMETSSIYPTELCRCCNCCEHWNWTWIGQSQCYNSFQLIIMWAAKWNFILLHLRDPMRPWIEISPHFNCDLRMETMTE